MAVLSLVLRSAAEGEVHKSFSECCCWMFVFDHEIYLVYRIVLKYILDLSEDAPPPLTHSQVCSPGIWNLPLRKPCLGSIATTSPWCDFRVRICLGVRHTLDVVMISDAKNGLIK